jgi:hypothetical protein
MDKTFEELLLPFFGRPLKIIKQPEKLTIVPVKKLDEIIDKSFLEKYFSKKRNKLNN